MIRYTSSQRTLLVDTHQARMRTDSRTCENYSCHGLASLHRQATDNLGNLVHGSIAGDDPKSVAFNIRIRALYCAELRRRRRT